MVNPVCVWDAKAILGEGACWHAKESAFYWVDIKRSSLHRISNTGRQESWVFPGKLSSVVPHLEGGLLATFEDGVRHIDLNTQSVAVIQKLEVDLTNNRFNDGYTDMLGQFWFGSMDEEEAQCSGRFYRLDSGGQVHSLDHFGSMRVTNGPTFSLDGKWIYFTDTLEAKVFRAELDDCGVPGEVEIYIEFSDFEGFPDGMCVDTKGGLWICHFGGFKITRFDESRYQSDEIRFPVPNITKCAFGGDTMQTLYVTTASVGLDEKSKKKYPLSGGVFTVDLPYTGVPATPASFANSHLKLRESDN